jgi:hypothetical protein
MRPLSATRAVPDVCPGECNRPTAGDAPRSYDETSGVSLSAVRWPAGMKPLARVRSLPFDWPYFRSDHAGPAGRVNSPASLLANLNRPFLP